MVIMRASNPAFWVSNVRVQIIDNERHQDDDHMTNHGGQQNLAAISESQQQAVLQ